MPIVAIARVTPASVCVFLKALVSCLRESLLLGSEFSTWVPGCYYPEEEYCDILGAGAENVETGRVSLAVLLAARLIDFARCHMCCRQVPFTFREELGQELA